MMLCLKILGIVIAEGVIFLALMVVIFTAAGVLQ
jgi:hypothetical protein